MGFAFESSADWTIVSTFDDQSALSIVTDLQNQAGSNAHSDVIDGKLVVFPGDLLEATSNLWTFVDLGVDLKEASIAREGFVTFYMEITEPLIEGHKAVSDVVWGLSNVDSDEVLTTRYNSYNAMQRIDSATDQFEGRNGSNYELMGKLDADVPYSIWIVVDYYLGYYETYVQGGIWTSPTKMPSSTTAWLFRVDPISTQTVDKFLIALTRGNTTSEKGKDPSYFDNIAYDISGENITKPNFGGASKGPGALGNYDMTAAGDVDTGNWLVWVNAAKYPWVYLYSTAGWAYFGTSDKDAAGAWIYMKK